MDAVREPLLGAALVAVGLALLGALTTGQASGTAEAPGWFSALRAFVVGTSGVAFIMMIYGMLTALVIGVFTRLWEMFTRSGARKNRKGKRASLRADDGSRMAA